MALKTVRTRTTNEATVLVQRTTALAVVEVGVPVLQSLPPRQILFILSVPRFDSSWQRASAGHAAKVPRRPTTHVVVIVHVAAGLRVDVLVRGSARAPRR